jgi:hypothetical protein
VYDMPVGVGEREGGSSGRGVQGAFEGSLMGGRISPSAFRGREDDGGRGGDRERGREGAGAGEGEGEGVFSDDSAAVMIGDRGPWGGNDPSSGESYRSESSDGGEEGEEEQEEEKRNGYLSIPGGYSDSLPAGSEYRGPSSDLLNSYMSEIYNA